MSEARHFAGIFRTAPKSDVAVLLTCFLLTVFFDMVIAVSVGFMLAAILFMRRMAELTEARLQFEPQAEGGRASLPKGVVLYEINGPLFFGAAQRAMGTLRVMRPERFRVLILHLGRVPVIDATGLAALENAVTSIMRQRRKVIIAGPLPRPRKVFDKARLETKYPGLIVTFTLESALQIAEATMSVEPPPSSRASLRARPNA
jgi:SulP family sulfate permease